MSNEPTRQELISGMREVLDFLAENPSFELPRTIRDANLSTYLPSPKRNGLLSKHARLLGTFEKSVDEYSFYITRSFGVAKLSVHCDRSDVCEKVKVTKEVEVEEWHCPDSLLELEAAVSGDRIESAADRVLEGQR